MGRARTFAGIPVVKYYFVGIGGYGMSGLARILAEAGYQVSGSDAKDSSRIAALRGLGIDIAVGHNAERVADAGIVVYSTDVPAHNPELLEARRRGIEVWHRSRLLAQLINHGRGIAVTGTHGKTTVTTMIGTILEDAGFDPTVSVGGEVDRWRGTSRLGYSEWLVAEACESDGTFVAYRPEIAVVNNIEPEHLDHYQGSYALLQKTFVEFVTGMGPNGTVIIGVDDPGARQLLDHVPGRVITFGFDEAANVRAETAELTPFGWEFTVAVQGEPVGRFRLPLPGLHNVRNALAAVAVGRLLQINPEIIRSSLAAFRGAHRRFEIVYERNGLVIVDDYAHHPTEIRATLQAARERSRGRVVAVFQPQRYSRTQRLMEEFGRAFAAADAVVLLPIYAPPGEEPIPGVSSEALARLVGRESPGKVVFLPDKASAVKWLEREIRNDDLVITMGAGDVGEVAYQLVGRMSVTGERHA